MWCLHAALVMGSDFLIFFLGVELGPSTTELCPGPGILRRAERVSSNVIPNSGEGRLTPDLQASALHPSPREQPWGHRDALGNLSGYLLPDRLFALQDGFFLSVPPGKSTLLTNSLAGPSWEGVDSLPSQASNMSVMK